MTPGQLTLHSFLKEKTNKKEQFAKMATDDKTRTTRSQDKKIIQLKIKKLYLIRQSFIIN